MANQLFLTLASYDPHFKVVKSQVPVWYLTTVYENLSSLWVEFKTNKYDPRKIYQSEYCMDLAKEILDLMPTISGRSHCIDFDWFFSTPEWLNYFVAQELQDSPV